MTFTIRNMHAEDVEAVAMLVALDHLEIVSQHCHVVENDKKQITAAMVLHPQGKVFEIEDLHVKDIEQNKEALNLLKAKLLEYLENVQTEVLCCPYAIRTLVKTY